MLASHASVTAFNVVDKGGRVEKSSLRSPRKQDLGWRLEHMPRKQEHGRLVDLVRMEKLMVHA